MNESHGVKFESNTAQTSKEGIFLADMYGRFFVGCCGSTK